MKKLAFLLIFPLLWGQFDDIILIDLASSAPVTNDDSDEYLVAQRRSPQVESRPGKKPAFVGANCLPVMSSLPHGGLPFDASRTTPVASSLHLLVSLQI